MAGSVWCLLLLYFDDMWFFSYYHFRLWSQFASLFTTRKHPISFISSLLGMRVWKQVWDLWMTNITSLIHSINCKPSEPVNRLLLTMNDGRWPLFPPLCPNNDYEWWLFFFFRKKLLLLVNLIFRCISLSFLLTSFFVCLFVFMHV